MTDEKYANQTFAYITSAKDGKAPRGQEALMDALDKKGIKYGYLQGIDHQGGEATETAVKNVLDKGYKQNFFQFEQVADGSPVKEHMVSFQAAYSVNALYEWLMTQSKE